MSRILVLDDSKTANVATMVKLVAEGAAHPSTKLAQRTPSG